MFELFTMSGVELLQFPFMQRAILAGIMLAIILGYLGIFVVLKRMSFVSDGVAHASLAGIAIGIVAGFVPLYTAIIWSVFFAVLVYFFEKRTTLAPDAIIGILFTSSMSLGVVLMSLKEGFQPDLVSFLFGNILAIRTSDLWAIGIVGAIVLLFLFFRNRHMTLLALHPEMAYLAGVNPNVYQLIFYILLAVSVVLGVKLVGVVLVSAFLIMPVSTAKLMSTSLRSLRALTLVIALGSMLVGLFVSASFNLPAGPAIVLTSGALFFAVFLVSTLRGATR